MEGVGKELKEEAKMFYNAKFSKKHKETIHQIMQQIDELLQTESPY